LSSHTLNDLVVGFENRAEAERFLKEFRDRLAKFGLELHAEKTRLIEFGRFAARNRKQRGEGKPETFTFLGFTHYCGKRRSNGTFMVWRETAKKRMVAKLRALKAELRRRMHEPVASVGEWLQKVTLGYYQYHAVPGNLDHLRVFMHRLRRLWRLVLIRCSQRRRATWDRLNPILNRWIPVPRVLHPYPIERFVATIQGGSRMRRRARTVLCGGRPAMVVPTATRIRSGALGGAASGVQSLYEWRVTRPGGIFMCCPANLRQVDWRRRGSPFAEASEPGGSRNGSTEMRS
jgi:hypothetical protein